MDNNNNYEENRDSVFDSSIMELLKSLSVRFGGRLLQVYI